MSITVTRLGKAFKRYPSKWARLGEWLTGKERHKKHWVLRDLNFSINPGESVGIVGINGAGKSTLLKIITGTTQPTCGSARVDGSLAALLELGMGFHPDFTGRQNVFMAGQLQGMSIAEIARLMPEIEAFAEIGDYIDQAVRVYSSGMQMRLAFSVAIARRPDVLIVDEALSVGDAYFQHKSFERIRAIRDAGTTLLVVSHDLGALKALCSRVLLIADGQVVRDGAPADILDYYNARIAPAAALPPEPADGAGMRSGDGRVRIESVELRDTARPCSAILAGMPATLRITATVHENLPDLTLGFLIRDRVGNDIFGTNTHYLAATLVPLGAGRRIGVDFSFPTLALGPGHYSVTVAAHASRDHLAGNHDWWDRALVFQVLPATATHSVGVCHMPVHCTIHTGLAAA